MPSANGGQRSIAVVGAGWAGLAAAVACNRAGGTVTLFEMAPMAGGRARDVPGHGSTLDNGQHIAIGAYRETLRLLADLGVAEADAFVRLPLRLVGADGRGLRLRPGPPIPAFAWAVLRRRGWSWRERLSLLATLNQWKRSGFVCEALATVAGLAAKLPPRIRADLIEPLCVAALNTPAAEASGAVFLRVLHDSLASGPGASDLLLPRMGLGGLLPEPASSWLAIHGAALRLAHRVERIEHAVDRDAWQVDGERFDRVVVAASALESARLVEPHDAAWARAATALRYEPIVTVYARSDGCHLPEPMLALPSDEHARPAQFVFDRGQLGGPAGLLAFVVSGAAPWVERGSPACETAVLDQGRAQLAAHLRGPLVAVRTIVEKRATFRCTPGLVRPSRRIAAGLVAAGDHIDGPYPATLEGAVQSGLEAARDVMA